MVMDTKQILLRIRGSRKRCFRFSVEHILTDLLNRHIGIEKAICQQRFTQLVEAEATFCTFNSLLAFAVTRDDTLYTFSCDIVSIVHHLNKNETAMTAILLVHVQDGMGGSARTGEGIEDDTIRICCDLHNTLNESNRFWIIKNGLAHDRCQQFVSFLCMSNFLMVPPSPRHHSRHFCQKPLNGGNTVTIASVDHFVFCNKLIEPFFCDTPAASGRRRYNPSRRQRNLVHLIRPISWCCEVVRLPWATRIIIGV